MPCDVGDRARVEGFVRTAGERFGRIDVLVNNAGVIQRRPAGHIDPRRLRGGAADHFWGPLYATLAVLPALRERGEGRIVNISSLGGNLSVPHLLPYSASKFALTGWSEGLRAELARDGIAVTTVCPGLMRTGSPRNAFFKGRHRAEYAWFSLGDALPFTSMSAARRAADRRRLPAWRRRTGADLAGGARQQGARSPAGPDRRRAGGGQPAAAGRRRHRPRARHGGGERVAGVAVVADDPQRARPSSTISCPTDSGGRRPRLFSWPSSLSPAPRRLGHGSGAPAVAGRRELC